MKGWVLTQPAWLSLVAYLAVVYANMDFMFMVAVTTMAGYAYLRWCWEQLENWKQDLLKREGLNRSKK